MRRRIRDGVLDEMIDRYVDWRHESAEVEWAYRRWSIAPSPDGSRAFAAYAAALEREELASIRYAEAMRRILLLVARDRRRRRSAAARRRTPAREPSRRRRRTRALRRAPRSHPRRTRRGSDSARTSGRARSRRRAG